MPHGQPTLYMQIMAGAPTCNDDTDPKMANQCPLCGKQLPRTKKKHCKKCGYEAEEETESMDTEIDKLLDAL
jgi:ribosomal protein L37E